MPVFLENSILYTKQSNCHDYRLFISANQAYSYKQKVEKLEMHFGVI